jgi:hypothetical protein
VSQRVPRLAPRSPLGAIVVDAECHRDPRERAGSVVRRLGISRSSRICDVAMQESALLRHRPARRLRRRSTTAATWLARRVATRAATVARRRCARNNFAVVPEIFAIVIPDAASRTRSRAPRGGREGARADVSKAALDARDDDARENFLRLIVDSANSRV